MGTHDRPGGRVLSRIPCPRLHEPGAGQRHCRWLRSRGVRARTVCRADDSLRLSCGTRPFLATSAGLVRSRIRTRPGSRLRPRRRSRMAVVWLVGRKPSEQRTGKEFSHAQRRRNRPAQWRRARTRQDGRAVRGRPRRSVRMPELRAQGGSRAGPALQPEDLPQVWNDNDQRLMTTSQQEGDQPCQVVTEQARREWAQ